VFAQSPRITVRALNSTKDVAKILSAEEQFFLSNSIRIQASELLGSHMTVDFQKEGNDSIPIDSLEYWIHSTLSIQKGKLQWQMILGHKLDTLRRQVLVVPASTLGKNQLGMAIDSTCKRLLLNFQQDTTPIVEIPQSVGVLVKATLEGRPGSIQFDSLESCENAKVCVRELLPGDHVVHFRRKGYLDSSITMEYIGAEEYSKNTCSVVLRPDGGELSIQTLDPSTLKPLRADVYVDGNRIGVTPWRGVVSTLAENIIVRSNSFVDTLLRDRPDRGLVKTLTIVMRPKKSIGYDGMADIPKGCFFMGSRRAPDERPSHHVCLDAFRMDILEVTQMQVQSILDTGMQGEQTCYEDCPARYISWADANEYCKRVGKRLPTEAEWEYAARAGSTAEWFWGDEYSDVSLKGVFRMQDSRTIYSSVLKGGQMMENHWSLMDMAGNVGEWVSDWYAPRYYSQNTPKNPKGPSPTELHLYRGGSYMNTPEDVRSAKRFSASGTPLVDVGFRCVAPSK